MWRSELSTSNQNLIRSGVFWLVRCWIVLVFSFFLLFFLNLLHNGAFPPPPPWRKPKQSALLKWRTQPPQQALCCSSASSSMDVSIGCNLPMASLSGIWLGVVSASPEAGCAPGLADCGGRGDLWVPEPGSPGSGSSSALCFQARAYGQGGPKEAEMRQNLSIKCLIM